MSWIQQNLELFEFKKIDENHKTKTGNFIISKADIKTPVIKNKKGTINFIYPFDKDFYSNEIQFEAKKALKIAKKNHDTVSNRLKLQENDSYLVSRKEEIGTANIIDSLVKQEELLLVRQQNVSSKVNEIIASINLYKATGGVDVFTTSNNNDL